MHKIANEIEITELIGSNDESKALEEMKFEDEEVEWLRNYDSSWKYEIGKLIKRLHKSL